jgi:hypothetical protein
VKLCGDQLIHMLSIICRSSRQQLGLQSFTAPSLERLASLALAFSPEGEVRARRRRRSIGLSTTCCQSSCTLLQLRLAC